MTPKIQEVVPSHIHEELFQKTQESKVGLIEEQIYLRNAGIVGILTPKQQRILCVAPGEGSYTP